MAIQAQYPSNVLLLNRSIQEEKNPPGNNYSLQPQPGGFLDQSTMIFANEVRSNPRKRAREFTEAAAAAAATTTSPVNNPFTNQFIDLTQLHPPQPNAVSTGLRLAFGEQNQQQQLRQQHQRLQHQSQQQTLSPQSSVQSSFLSEDLAAQIRQHRDQIEQFLHAQGEQLRRTLAEKRQRDYRALLGAAEKSASQRLREKEAEVEKAARRNAELEARAAQLIAEARAWQSRAREQEAEAAALQAQLQHAIISGGAASGEDKRDELGCGGEAEDEASAYVDPDRVVVASGPSCKACRKRTASVVVLPCRHLCLCTECGSVVQACPLCLTFRESSVDVFLS